MLHLDPVNTTHGCQSLTDYFTDPAHPGQNSCVLGSVVGPDGNETPVLGHYTGCEDDPDKFPDFK
jgi:hypothetical protein